MREASSNSFFNHLKRLTIALFKKLAQAQIMTSLSAKKITSTNRRFRTLIGFSCPIHTYSLPSKTKPILTNRWKFSTTAMRKLKSNLKIHLIKLTRKAVILTLILNVMTQLMNFLKMIASL